MIKYICGDIFYSPTQTIVIPVNTVGVMGKGLALQAKERYPQMYDWYNLACITGDFKIGNLQLWRTLSKWLLLFPTKMDWRNPSRLEYIDFGLWKFTNVYKEMEIESISFPKLGCGYGGLSFNDVKPIMEEYLSNLPIKVYIYSKEESVE
jgi:O-acetyl-ADP-ribose deacetylase (regulator of RNase III)